MHVCTGLLSAGILSHISKSSMQLQMFMDVWKPFHANPSAGYRRNVSSETLAKICREMMQRRRNQYIYTFFSLQHIRAQASRWPRVGIKLHIKKEMIYDTRTRSTERPSFLSKAEELQSVI